MRGRGNVQRCKCRSISFFSFRPSLQPWLAVYPHSSFTVDRRTATPSFSFQCLPLFLSLSCRQIRKPRTVYQRTGSGVVGEVCGDVVCRDYWRRAGLWVNRIRHGGPRLKQTLHYTSRGSDRFEPGVAG